MPRRAMGKHFMGGLKARSGCSPPIRQGRYLWARRRGANKARSHLIVRAEHPSGARPAPFGDTRQSQLNARSGGVGGRQRHQYPHVPAGFEGKYLRDSRTGPQPDFPATKKAPQKSRSRSPPRRTRRERAPPGSTAFERQRSIPQPGRQENATRSRVSNLPPGTEYPS